MSKDFGKYLCCADTHITAQAPIFRTDNYLETGLNKLRWIVDTANEHSAHILFPGDMFENLKVGYKVVNRVIEILGGAQGKVIVAPGQHDKYFHSQDLHDTPIYNVAQSGVITLVGSGIVSGAGLPHKIYCLGHDFPDDKIREAEKGAGILIAHRCVTPSTPPFFLEEALSAEDFVNEYSQFPFIVTGDYHVPFVYKERGHILINCGSMLRKAKDQIKYKPRVHLLDTINWTVKKIKIPIKPAETVFDFNMISISDKSNFSEEVEELVKDMADDSKPNFLVNMKRVIKKVRPNRRVNKLIKNYVGKYAERTK